MCITLSQSSERPMDDRSCAHARRILPMIEMLLLLAMTTACDRVEMGPDVEPDAPASASFEWPDDPSHPTLTVEIESKGTIVIELMPELAPRTVDHIIDLTKDGYYDGTTFHRVIPGFMIQGGDPNSRDRDPNNDGNGNPDIRIADEFGDAPFVRGVVGMGNRGHRHSTGGQFFIMHADNRSIDGRYTTIGRVISGIEVVDAITQVSIDRIGRWGPKNRPIENVLMKRVAIREQAAENQRVTTRSAGLGGDTDR